MVVHNIPKEEVYVLIYILSEVHEEKFGFQSIFFYSEFDLAIYMYAHVTYVRPFHEIDIVLNTTEIRLILM